MYLMAEESRRMLCDLQTMPARFLFLLLPTYHFPSSPATALSVKPSLSPVVHQPSPYQFEQKIGRNSLTCASSSLSLHHQIVAVLTPDQPHPCLPTWEAPRLLQHPHEHAQRLRHILSTLSSKHTQSEVPRYTSPRTNASLLATEHLSQWQPSCSPCTTSHLACLHLLRQMHSH